DLYPVLDYEDEYALKIAHIPYTPKFFVALGTMIVRRMHSLRSAPRKVIAVDCDNTLWNGVCGEEGATGVCVDPPRRTLQDFLIDDNPLECAEVRAACREVLVLELPADAERIPTFVRHVWAFDHWKVTTEDTKRNPFYRQERAREEVREQATTFEDFLALLGL